MTHDILIISDPEDKTASDMIARRLRSLKFQVRNNRAPKRSTPTAKDADGIADAKTVLVLWSKATKSEDRPQAAWLQAMAAKAATSDQIVVHARLDSADPGIDGDTFDLNGLTGRKMVPGFVDAVALLGASISRPGLRDWLALKSNDADGQSAWQAAHPNDPLSENSDTADNEDTAPSRVEVAAEPVKPRMVIPPPVHAELKPKRFDPSQQPPAGGEFLLVGVGLGIFLMFVFAFLVRSEPLMQEIEADIVPPPFAAPCRDNPDDQRCRQPLQTGPIIDDTE